MVNVNFSQFVGNNHKSEMIKDFLKNFKDIQLDLFVILDLDYSTTSFLEEAFSTEMYSCNILKWSYVLSEFTPKNHKFREIFTYQLETAQMLSDTLYESIIDKLMKFWKGLKPISDA